MPRLHKREWIIALIAVLVTLTIGVPTGMALADPAPAAGTEEAPDNECDDILGTGTPEFMYCKWMAKTPREALDIVRFWARNDGQKLQDAVPYPGPVLFCMDQTNKGPGMQDCADKDQVLCKYDHDAGKYVCKDVDGNITKPPAKACQGGEFDCSGGAGATGATPAPGDGGTRSGQATAAPDVQPDVTQMPVDDKSQAPPSDPSAPPTGQGDPNGPADPSADPSAPPAADPTAEADPSTAPQPTASTAPEPSQPADPAPSATPTKRQLTAPNDATGKAAAAAVKLNMRVWIEGELAPAWQAGKDQFDAAVASMAAQASRPGVVGVKFAQDLGYWGFKTAADVRKFVKDSSTALRAAMPAGRQLAVDVVVPEMGCGASETCVAALRTKYPLITRANVEKYVLTGDVDHVNVSSGLFASEYSKYKITPDKALRNQWIGVRARGWDTRVHIGAREVGLAHSGANKLTAAQAEAAAKLRVDLPLQAGVQTVMLWTHRQNWDGTTWRLLDQGLANNTMWKALQARKGLGRLAVTFDASDPEKSITADLNKLSEVFNVIYIHSQ
ncbi:hypothetical protein GCM10009677_21070 [Sphaerisporangium rubeum]|uniref:Uncharacterized protein n=1 Tax=Sphaerisporangium rubeum TaxID=321317 RepID=A0A7X0IAS3_9ACTN|nr:hypothetical protein [Sphaerisporangium rubeum]MBB6471787.1 hypothetical protein [Sphaerisporangium rubeum]